MNRYRTKEEIELLYRELSARQPYSVKFCYNHRIYRLNRTFSYDNESECMVYSTTNDFIPIRLIQLYLRPLSSMTEDEEIEWRNLEINPLLENIVRKHTRAESLYLYAQAQAAPLNWLNEHHFDYNNLIKKGLALEAPKDMYK